MPPEVVQPQETGTTTPAPGGETPGTPGSSPTTPETETPFFIAKTQEEFEARFGPEKTSAKKALAKSLGFDSIDALNAAVTDYKTRTEAEKTELQRIQDAHKDATKSNKTLAEENKTLKLERATERQALSLDVDPKKLDTVMTLLKAGGEVQTDGEGNIDQAALKTRLEGILQAHPYFKSTPTTIGAGSNPANAANAPGAVDKNPFSKEHRNLTKQAEILRTNPALARQLQASAQQVK